MPRYIDEKDVYALVEPHGTAKVHCAQIDELPRADVVPKSEVDILKSLITHKEEEAYEKGYKDGIEDFAEAVKLEFYRQFDEIIPSIMADRIDELKKEYTE